MTSNLARGLREQGQEVTVLAQRYPRTLAKREVMAGVEVERLLFLVPRWSQPAQGRMDLFAAGLVYFPLTLARLVWRLRRGRYDMVNLHFAGAPALFLLWAHRLLHFHYIVSLHGDDVEAPQRGTEFDRRVFRATLREADAVTACSGALLGQALASAPEAASKARVIYNGIPVPAEAVASGAGNDAPFYFAAGRMVPKKGFDVLVRAIALCAEGGHPVRLELAGDGPERGRLETLAKQLHAAEHIHFAGTLERDALLGRMSECRAVIVPSRREPFGMVALEGMAYGKPVIATHVDGLAEVLEDAAGVMAPPDNPRALAEAILETEERLARDATFGAQNRDAVKRFSQERMNEAFAALYRRVQAGD